MRNFLLLLVAVLSTTTLTNAEERVINKPSFSAWNSTTMEIDKIVLNDTATIIYADAFFRPGWWIRIAADTYIEADGIKYPIRQSINIDLDAETYMPESGELSFQLVFPAIPENIKKIDLYEGEDAGGFHFWGIHLDNGDITSYLADKVKTQETPVLEPPVLFYRDAVLKGRIANYPARMNAELNAWTYNTITNNYDEYTVPVEPDGSFNLVVPMAHIGKVMLNSSFLQGAVFLKPGEETFVEINLPEVTRSASRYLKDKPTLGEKYFYSGALASFNEYIASMPLKQLNVAPDSEETYMQMITDVATMNMQEYKNYFIDRYTNALKELDNYPEINEDYRKLLISEASLTLIGYLMNGHYMIERAYKSVNGIEMDTPLDDFQQNIIPDDYYNFVSDYFPRDSYALFEPSYMGLLTAFQHILDQPEEQRLFELTFTSVDELVNNEKMILDLLRIQDIAGPIANFMPVSDELLAEAGTIAPSIQSMLVARNERLKNLIEENKRKTGYNVHAVDINEIPAEDLFAAITEPYRGKVVFVDFWATWCGPCRSAMKVSEPVKEEFTDKDVVFLYLAGEDSPEGTWNNMIPDIKGDHYRVNKEQYKYWRDTFGISGVPSYMIIAKDGTPTHFQVGFMGVPRMREMLLAELEK